MTTLEVFKKDEKRLSASLRHTRDMERAIRLLDEELSRILTACSQSCRDEQEAFALRLAIETARSALELTDSEGEVVFFDRSAKNGAYKERRTLLPVTGVVLGLLAVLAASWGNGFGLHTLLVALFAAGCGLFCYGAGRAASGAAVRQAQALPDWELRPDGEKLLRHFSTLLFVIDRTLEEQPEPEQRQLETARDGALRLEAGDETELCQELLEEAYAIREDASARAMISSIGYYLHQKGIRAVDYSKDYAQAFDLIPGDRRETIRPALVSDRGVLCRGIACGFGIRGV